MAPETGLFDAHDRPLAIRERRREAATTDEIAGRGRDDIFFGYIRTTGVGARAVVLNPDAVLNLEARGQGLALYDEVLRDAKVSSQMGTRIGAVVGKEWRILPADDTPQDTERATFVEQRLKKLSCFHLDLEQALDAIAKGFAIQEVMWAIEDGHVVITDLRHRDPRRFAFTLDGALRLITTAHPLEGEDVPSRKFLHYVFKPRYENPYGDALMSRVYWWWWFKKHAVKFWMIFSEKFGQPTAIGKYPPGATPDQQDKLLDAIAAIQTEYAVKIPETMKIDLLEAERTSSINTYKDFLEYCDTQIGLAILGQTLTSQVGASGSYAAAKVHNEVRQDYVESDAKMLEAPINSALIPWLVDYNFPPTPAGYPRFVLMVTPEADTIALAARDKQLVDMGLRVPVSYVYETYRIPAPEPGDDVLVPPAAAVPAVALPAPTPASHAAAFAAEEDGAAERLVVAALPRALVIYDDLLVELRRELEESADYEAARRRLDVALSPEELRPFGELLHAVLLTGHLVGQAEVLEEAAAADEAFVELEVLEPMPPDEALRFFTGKVPMTREQFLALSDPLRARAFTLARAGSVQLVDAVKQQLVRGLAEGTPFTDFLRALDTVFDRAGVTRANPHHAETVFRTNTHTAYQAGRFEQLTGPGIDEIFPFFEYHTAGDERVRFTHARMAGVIRKRTDPVWDKWWPPNGFSCRCTVTAISKAEIRRRGLRETSLPKVEPDKGFAVNPAKLVRGAA